MAKFYSNVKDKVKKEEGSEEDDSASSASTGKASFNQLIENAEQASSDEDDPADNTEIEDLSRGSSSKDYKDPSKIELNSNSNSQAGQSSEKGGKDAASRSHSGTTGAKSQARNNGTPGHRRQDKGKRSSKRSSRPKKHSKASKKSSTPKSRTSNGSTRSQSGSNLNSDPEILEDIRNQNNEIIRLLKNLNNVLEDRF
ncbi:MAG: hypothetical protein SVV03_04570 [Candidatus Nanohaloarchaea archaeon]|nr:hypothetical protein [Candidatus Nanohaloarchaea archaeon]